METIKNYLETMFANLPNTVEVKRAKDELYSMMEDKYTELINEGKAENEAIGIIISEFGNLDEIAETLGIGNVVNEVVVSDRRLITQQDAINYTNDVASHRYFIGLGVLLCVFSVIGPILFDAIGTMIHVEAFTAIGVALMFICVAAAVGLFIMSSFRMKEWNFLDKELCTVDYSTAEFLSREKEDNQTYKGILLTVGIMLCILSVIPVIVFDAMLGENFKFITEGIAPSLIFIGSGIGVFFIIVSGAKASACEKLLSLNDVNTVAGNYEPVKKHKKMYVNKAAEAVMGEYWKTVSCIYLIYSFLTFNWATSWIIWPVAAILYGPLKGLFQKNGGDAK